MFNGDKLLQSCRSYLLALYIPEYCMTIKILFHSSLTSASPARNFASAICMQKSEAEKCWEA